MSDMNIGGKQRLEWIDALRGLAMLLVIYGHQVTSSEFPTFFRLTNPVKMPLFFAITGFVFNIKGGEVIPFFRNLFIKIIIPWLCLSCIPILINAPFEPIQNLLEKFLEILSGKRVWFMPCIIVAEILHFFVRKFSKKPYHVVLISVLLTIVGFLCAKCNILNYAMVNRALIVQVFIAFGYIVKTYQNKIFSMRWSWIICISIVYLALTISNRLFFHYPLDIHINCYSNIPYNFLQIFCGLFMCFLLFSKILHAPRWLVFIGQNTLIYYIWQGYCLALFSAVLSLFGLSYTTTPLTGIINTIVICIGCFVFSVLVNRYAPFLVGKKKRTVRESV